MIVTREVLAAIMPYSKHLNEFLDPLNSAMDRFEINTHERVAMFLAQAAHESTQLNVLRENLNYSAEALLKLFPSHFTFDEAMDRARDPERIANHLYAKRMGNGDESTGDGWKYRGAGVFQITGKNEFAACSTGIYGDLEVLLLEPERLVHPVDAAASAAWFWNSNRLNDYADRGDLPGCTRKVNGGLVGLTERQALYVVALGAVPGE